MVELNAKLSDEFVRAAFRGLLGREPDPNALAVCTRELAEKKDLSVALSMIDKSQEHFEKLLAEKAEELVKMVYRGLLERDPDTQGLKRYAKVLAEKKDLNEILASVSSSDEFLKKRLKVRQYHAPAFAVRDLAEHKLVFMHIPKTGGTTLHHILVNAFDKREVCPERFNGLRHYPVGELVRYRYFSGHFDLPSVRLIPGRKKLSPCCESL